MTLRMISIFGAAICMAVLALGQRQSASSEVTTTAYIVQAASTASAKQAVHAVDGVVTHELNIIDAVGALLTPEQREQLSNRQGIRLTQNRQASLAGPALAPETHSPDLIRASALHDTA